VIRNPAKWNGPGTPRLADLTDATALAACLADATIVVSCAHARHTEAILAAAPPTAHLVLLGSTRRFTRWPDEHGRGVQQGEAALLASGRPGVILHPTMIYGAGGEDNVQRLAALLRRLPLVPLPGGGRALVQPIHQDDVTACVVAAIGIPWTAPRALVIAGPTPLAYADFVRAVAHAAGLKRPRIASLPAGPLMLASGLTALLPFLPRIGAAEIRRLTEDKAFPIADMRTVLVVEPRSLTEGLAQTFRS